MTTRPHSTEIPYENNPFVVAIDGLKLLFGLALPVAIFACLFAFVSWFGSPFQQSPLTVNTQEQPQTIDQLREQTRDRATTFFDSVASLTSEQWATYTTIALLAAVVVIYITTTIAGIYAVTSARISRGEKTTFIEAFNASQSRFFGFLWLQILTTLKIIAWSLLFVVPGIIMAVRYSLAGAAFFDKNLSAPEAIKRSARITKGAWLTTSASFYLLNLLTLGLINNVLATGTRAVLYRQLTAYDTANLNKPKPHTLSFIALLIPLTALIAIALLAIIFIVVVMV